MILRFPALVLFMGATVVGHIPSLDARLDDSPYLPNRYLVACTVRLACGPSDLGYTAEHSDAVNPETHNSRRQSRTLLLKRTQPPDGESGWSRERNNDITVYYGGKHLPHHMKHLDLAHELMPETKKFKSMSRDPKANRKRVEGILPVQAINPLIGLNQVRDEKLLAMVDRNGVGAPFIADYMPAYESNGRYAVPKHSRRGRIEKAKDEKSAHGYSMERSIQSISARSAADDV